MKIIYCHGKLHKYYFFFFKIKRIAMYWSMILNLTALSRKARGSDAWVSLVLIQLLSKVLGHSGCRRTKLTHAPGTTITDRHSGIYRHRCHICCKCKKWLNTVGNISVAVIVATKTTTVTQRVNITGRQTIWMFSCQRSYQLRVSYTLTETLGWKETQKVSWKCPGRSDVLNSPQ